MVVREGLELPVAKQGGPKWIIGHSSTWNIQAGLALVKQISMKHLHWRMLWTESSVDYAVEEPALILQLGVLQKTCWCEIIITC